MWLRSLVHEKIMPPRTEVWKVQLEEEQERVREAHQTETVRLDDLTARRRLIAAEVRNLERIARRNGHER